MNENIFGISFLCRFWLVHFEISNDKMIRLLSKLFSLGVWSNVESLGSPFQHT